jgi:hypothetical protein
VDRAEWLLCNSVTLTLCVVRSPGKAEWGSDTSVGELQEGIWGHSMFLKLHSAGHFHPLRPPREEVTKPSASFHLHEWLHIKIIGYLVLRRKGLRMILGRRPRVSLKSQACAHCVIGEEFWHLW